MTSSYTFSKLSYSISPEFKDFSPSPPSFPLSSDHHIINTPKKFINIRYSSIIILQHHNIRNSQTMDQQKPTKSKNTLLKFLPKPTSSVSFQNPPIYSPVRDKRLSEKPHKSNLGIGFSAPLVSMILADTRRQVKNNHGCILEPTSPRVSCMGQVKCKNKNKNRKPQLPSGNRPSSGVKPLPTRVVPHKDDDNKESKADGKSLKKLGFKKIFGGITPSRRTSDSTAPSLGSMKRFSSGRDKFSSYDWTKEVAAMEYSGDRRYDSDEESDDGHLVVPSSAPVIIRSSLGFDDNIVRVADISTEPRNEINLWKRRTMQQPKPLSIT